MHIEPLSIHAHQRAVTQVVYSPGGELLVSTSKEPTVKMWNAATGALVGTFGTCDAEGKATSGHSAVSACAFNRAATFLATAGLDFRTILWSTQTGEELAVIEQPAICRSTAFAHDDSLLLVTTDGMREVTSSAVLYNLPENLGHAYSLPKFNPCLTIPDSEGIRYAVWGPTNTHIYYCTKAGTVVKYDVVKEREVCAKPVHSADIPRIRFDRSYMTLITASSDRTSKLLDMRNLEVISTYNSMEPVNDADVSPLTDQIILGGGVEADKVTTTGGQSGFHVKVFHKVFEDMLGSMRAHFGTITTVTYSPDGGSIATGGHDGHVKVFRMPPAYYDLPPPLWSPPCLS